MSAILAAGLFQDPQAAAIVDAIHGMVRACGCDVITEGLERRAQLEFMTVRGGFGLARPADVATTAARLRARLPATASASAQ